jgi:FixJ family two-component response regulator
VFVVEDDEAVRNSLRGLARSAGLAAEAFASAEEFLEGFDPSRSGCLVLDIRLGSTSGLDLQEELAQRGSSLPVIMITAYGTIPSTVRAMRNGAIDFLQKPFPPRLLLDRIREAIDLDRANRAREKRHARVEAQLAGLTPREGQVLEHIKLGRTSREIAEALDLSPRTVEGHRQVVLRKLGVNSTAQLMRLLLSLDE